MHADWFFPWKLALRLGRGEVPHREVAYIMLANQVFMFVIFYGAFTWANPPWTWLSLVECLTVLAVTVMGFTKCYDAAGGDTNPSFARDFNCLTFGVWFWTTAIVWVCYWAGVWLFRQGVFAAFRFDQLGIARNLVAIGGGFDWLWTVAAAVAWQIAFFSWLARCLVRVRAGA